MSNAIRNFEDSQGWWGFDLDGTLAEYSSWKGADHIGDLIEPIAELIRELLAEGERVKIFTARVTVREDGQHEVARRAIEEYTLKHFGVALEVTNVKDYGMIRLYDDRAVGVEENTGRFIINHIRRS